jgi:tryptophan 2,3-dioxygenase
VSLGARVGEEGPSERPDGGQPSPPFSYSSYLRLDDLLSLQVPITDTHDELLFIVVHQAHELWFRLILHELEAARTRMFEGDAYRSINHLQRVMAVERLLLEQVNVLDTMAPPVFLEFRARLASASGFQSVQFREIEVVSGLRDAEHLSRMEMTSEERARIELRFREPTLWDAFCHLLETRGSPSLIDLFLERERYGDLFLVSERLIDHDQAFTLWRARHVQMVERQIGSRPGTGGSTGTSYLRATLEKRFFPELWAVRSRLRARTP